jgi:hypothetical protein
MTMSFVQAQLVYPLLRPHDADYLGTTLKQAFTERQVHDSKISAVETDNAANIDKAVHDSFDKAKHLPCLAHTLALILVEAIDSTAGLKDLISKVKSIVTFFKQCISASDQLRKVQIDQGEPEGTVLKLKQVVPTHWNSTVYVRKILHFA